MRGMNDEMDWCLWIWRRVVRANPAVIFILIGQGVRELICEGD